MSVDEYVVCTYINELDNFSLYKLKINNKYKIKFIIANYYIFYEMPDDIFPSNYFTELKNIREEKIKKLKLNNDN